MDTSARGLSSQTTCAVLLCARALRMAHCIRVHFGAMAQELRWMSSAVMYERRMRTVLVAG